MPANRLDKCDPGLTTFELSKKSQKNRKESGCLDSNHDFLSEPFFRKCSDHKDYQILIFLFLLYFYVSFYFGGH